MILREDDAIGFADVGRTAVSSRFDFPLLASRSPGLTPRFVVLQKWASMLFDWDAKKAAENRRKHGVTFEEAATCFADPNGCYFRNESPSYEDRLILIALSEKQRLLFVVHAEVGRDSIRIVSARKASPAQRKLYQLG